MPLLEIKDVSISFGGIMALSGISLQVPDEKIIAVIGPNGSGKTTLFNCLTGIYRPDEGEISFKRRKYPKAFPGCHSRNEG